MSRLGERESWVSMRAELGRVNGELVDGSRPRLKIAPGRPVPVACSRSRSEPVELSLQISAMRFLVGNRPVQPGGNHVVADADVSRHRPASTSANQVRLALTEANLHQDVIRCGRRRRVYRPGA